MEQQKTNSKKEHDKALKSFAGKQIVINFNFDKPKKYYSNVYAFESRSEMNDYLKEKYSKYKEA
jgi:hypothetical protein